MFACHDDKKIKFSYKRISKVSLALCPIANTNADTSIFSSPFLFWCLWGGSPMPPVVFMVGSLSCASHLPDGIITLLAIPRSCPLCLASALRASALRKREAYVPPSVSDSASLAACCSRIMSVRTNSLRYRPLFCFDSRYSAISLSALNDTIFWVLVPHFAFFLMVAISGTMLIFSFVSIVLKFRKV